MAIYPNNGLSVLFQATVEGTEEAIVNAMVAAETTIGASGLRVVELPEEQLRELMSRKKPRCRVPAP